MTRPFARVRTLVVAVGFLALQGTPIAAQTLAATRSAKTPAKAYAPPKTPWGDPDLQGIYTKKDESGTPLERPAEFDGKKFEDLADSEFAEILKQRSDALLARAPTRGGETGAGPIHWYENYNPKNSRGWLVVEPADGRIPSVTAAADQRAAASAAARVGRGPADSYEDRSLFDQCISRSLPSSMIPDLYGNAYQIHQGPGFVAIRYEMIHETRIIPLDGRPHIGPRIHSYMGDARGHWSGNTLVVETTNFLERAANRGASENLRLVEQFKSVAPAIVEWSVQFNDPATWTRPWTFAMNLTKDPSPGTVRVRVPRRGLRTAQHPKRGACRGESAVRIEQPRETAISLAAMSMSSADSSEKR